MLCPNGHENGPTNTYCVDCGTRLGGTPPSGLLRQPVAPSGRQGTGEAVGRHNRSLRTLSVLALLAAVTLLGVASVIVLTGNNNGAEHGDRGDSQGIAGNEDTGGRPVYVDVLLSDLDDDLVGEVIQVRDESGEVIGETYIEPLGGYSLDTGVRSLSVFTSPTDSSTVEVSISGCKGRDSTYSLDIAGNVGSGRTFTAEESGQDDTYEYVTFEVGFLVSDRRPLTCETFANSG